MTSTESTSEGSSRGDVVVELRESAYTQLRPKQLCLTGAPRWRGVRAKVEQSIGGTSQSRYETNGGTSSLLLERLCEDSGLYLLIALNLGILEAGRWVR